MAVYGKVFNVNTVANGAAQPVPLTILTGFLGSGKTTLLNHILTGDHGLKVGILVNDFGAINVDAELVVDVEDGMIALANGCVCCQIRDDLIESVAELLERDEPVEYIILEASGVADPSGIFMTFVDSKYRDLIRLDSVTCVVDADQVFTYDEPELAQLKLAQIGFSDLVILNKVDLAGVEGAAKVKRWIDHHFKRVRLVPAVNCKVPLDILLSVGRFDQTAAMKGAEHSHKHNHDHDHSHDTNHGDLFSTWSYESDRPFARKALQDMIKQKLPPNIYRCKGVVQIAEAPAKRLILQVVGRRADMSVDEAWGKTKPHSRIVAIAHRGSLNEEELTSLFDSCLEPEVAAVGE